MWAMHTQSFIELPLWTGGLARIRLMQVTIKELKPHRLMINSWRALQCSAQNTWSKRAAELMKVGYTNCPASGLSSAGAVTCQFSWEMCETSTASSQSEQTAQQPHDICLFIFISRHLQNNSSSTQVIWIFQVNVIWDWLQKSFKILLFLLLFFFFLTTWISIQGNNANSLLCGCGKWQTVCLPDVRAPQKKCRVSQQLNRCKVLRPELCLVRKKQVLNERHVTMT